MIGLGVGIDYALLVVTRHREGLAAGLDPGESIRVAMTTAGRSVLVAGTTVVVAILSLYLIGIPFVSALGLASAIAVGAALLASVTLLPAMLAVLGRHLDHLRVRSLRFDNLGGAENGWYRWARLVQRRRWFAATTATLLLLVLAVPLLSLRLGMADDGSQAEGTTQRKAYDLVETSFGAGWTGPLLVTADYGPDATKGEVAAAAADLRATLQATEGVAQVTPPQVDPAGQTAVLSVVPTGSPDDESTEALLHELRSGELADTTGSPETHVGGATATNVDLADKLGDRMVWFMGLVVGLAFLLLLIEFRSLFVAGMAVVMNLLAVGAAYGPVVAVFQWGWWPANLIGVEPGPVESFAPVMLFAVLFGLSTDYAVFLLSRVHEVFRATGDPGRAVREGLAATARVILAAASVMVVVFASFMLNDQRVVNLFGFGLAMAIAVYALVAMLVLVPAALTMAGGAAWWLPDRLARRLPVAPVEPEEDPVPRKGTERVSDHAGAR
jgi:RND superfamily putative drug exporter